MFLFLVVVSSVSALRFNEVHAGVESVAGEGNGNEVTDTEGRRRRRRKGVGFYDSPNVEYIIQYPGKRVTDAVKVEAYRVKLAADVASLVLGELVLTAGVAETALKVNKDVKDNLKVSDWTLQSSLLQTGDPTFTDLVSWPENPGWKTTAPVAPSVFDSLFKTTGFTGKLQALMRVNNGDVEYTQYGVKGLTASVVERTVSTSSLIGTFKVKLVTSNPAGGPTVITPVSSFGSDYSPASAEFQGNPQSFMYEAKLALATAFNTNKDYVTIERSDYLANLCSSQIFFNFPTIQEAGNAESTALQVQLAALKDFSGFYKIFINAAATVLDVDASKITVNTFLSKTKKVAVGAGTGATVRIIDIQLKYETPCTTLNTAVPFWYDEEAFRVNTAIGTTSDLTGTHLLMANKIWTEAKKSSPFLVKFNADDEVLWLANTDAKATNNAKYITLQDVSLGLFALEQGRTGALIGGAAAANAGGGAAAAVGTPLIYYNGVADQIYRDGAGKAAATTVAQKMNAQWGSKANTVAAPSAEYRIKYVIAIKNAVDQNAASLIKSYVDIADKSADDDDAFSKKVKDSFAGSTQLLNLGCSVTNVWMRSESTATLF